MTRAEKRLSYQAGENVRAWLQGRGITTQTAKKASLGWNPKDDYRDRESWGLPTVQKPDGRSKKLWLPGGLVIPLLDGDHVTRLRIRRQDPGDGSRYVVVSGSGMGPMTLGSWETGVAVVVESELDGLLLTQEAGDLGAVVALGSAQAKPDAATHELLTRAEIILVSLDADPAGAKASWGWWTRTYPHARRWPPVGGKDPGEMFEHGLSVRTWIEAGLLYCTC